MHIEIVQRHASVWLVYCCRCWYPAAVCKEEAGPRLLVLLKQAARRPAAVNINTTTTTSGGRAAALMPRASSRVGFLCKAATYAGMAAMGVLAVVVEAGAAVG